MHQCNLALGQQPGAQLQGRQHFLNLISVQPRNASLAGNRPTASNTLPLNASIRLVDVKCRASSTDTDTRNAEWPPLQGNFTYKQLRALPVSIESATCINFYFMDATGLNFRHVRALRFTVYF